MIFPLKFYWENITSHAIFKYKMIDFAPINKSVVAYQIPWTIFERFLRRIKFPLTR